jgi:hypothetical protein
MLLGIFQLGLQRQEVLVKIGHVRIFGLTVTSQRVSLIFQGFYLDL